MDQIWDQVVSEALQSGLKTSSGAVPGAKLRELIVKAASLRNLQNPPAGYEMNNLEISSSDSIQSSFFDAEGRKIFPQRWPTRPEECVTPLGQRNILKSTGTVISENEFSIRYPATAVSGVLIVPRCERGVALLFPREQTDAK